jgi:hypothetical protein
LHALPPRAHQFIPHAPKHLPVFCLYPACSVSFAAISPKIARELRSYVHIHAENALFVHTTAILQQKRRERERERTVSQQKRAYNRISLAKNTRFAAKLHPRLLCHANNPVDKR